MNGHDKLVQAAVRAVLDGAALAEKSPPSAWSAKDEPRDLVTDVDRRVQTLMQSQLREATGLPVVAEEDPVLPLALPAEYWAVDPIDGTVNFFNELPLFAVCAGLVRDGLFEIGAICAPRLNQLYFTLEPGCALLNGRPVRHIERPLAQSLIAVSFPTRAEFACYAEFERLNRATLGCLRTGSAAVNICWVAANRLQAAVGFEARVWDVAGALAVARAAGCDLAVNWASPSVLDYCVGSTRFVDGFLATREATQPWRRYGD